MRQSEGLRHSLLTISSYSLASAFSAVAVILISRLLGPVGFADFSLAFSLSLLLNRLNDFGLSTVIQKYVGGEWRQHKLSAYLSILLRYRLVASVLLTTLGIIFAQPLSALFHLSNPALIPLSFICSLSVTYFEGAQVMLQSLAKFKLAAYNYVLPALLKFTLAVVVFVWYIPDISLILSLYLLSTLPSLLVAEIYKPKFIKYQLERRWPKEEKKIQGLLQHSAFAVIAAGVIENIDILFAKHYLSAYEVGLLAGVNRIAMLLYVVAYALANVLNPRVANYRQQVHFDAFLRKAYLIMLAAVGGFFLLLPFTHYLIAWTIGPAYLAGESVLVVLLAAGFISIMLVPFMATFYAFRNNSYFSQSAILQLVIVLLGNFFLVPVYGLTASVYTRLAARLALLFFTWLLLWWHYRREFGSQKSHK